jgi:hypothetical protein
LSLFPSDYFANRLNKPGKKEEKVGEKVVICFRSLPHHEGPGRNVVAGQSCLSGEAYRVFEIAQFIPAEGRAILPHLRKFKKILTF